MYGEAAYRKGKLNPPGTYLFTLFTPTSEPAPRPAFPDVDNAIRPDAQVGASTRGLDFSCFSSSASG